MSSEHFPYVASRRPAKRGLLIGAVLASAAGCFSPNVDAPDCAIECISECPSGYDCRNGLCARTDSTATCSLAGAGGSSDSAGSGGAFSAAGAGTNGGGVSGNAPSSAGAAGELNQPLELTFAPIHGLCPGEPYEVDLAADGGVPPYTWSLVMDSTGAKLSSKTGAAISLTGALDKSQPAVTVAIEDSVGTTRTKGVAFNVLAAGLGLCPAVRAAALPAACTDNPYVVSEGVIAVDGGSAPFTWEAISIPQGLQFDKTNLTLSGTALSAGKDTALTLRVTDAKGIQSERTYPLEYRDKCWLAFTQNGDGGARLRLYDPALEIYAASIESSPNNTGVVDFKFSPDGNLIAYRRATFDRSQELVLVNVPTWQEQVLAIPGSVVSYSWSPGARFLAVAYLDSAGSTWLGGIDATDSDSAFASQSELPRLNPAEVLDATYPPLNSDLLWLEGNALVAFHAADPLWSPDAPVEDPFLANFDGHGFPAFLSITDPTPSPIDLEPAFHGVFTVAGSAAQGYLTFWDYTSTETDIFLRGNVQSGVADPEGKFVATPLQGGLELFSTAESGGTQDPPTPWGLSKGGKVDVGCSSILAWNPGSEQIACDATLGDPPNATGEVRLFNLDETTASANKLPLAGLSGYYQGDASTRRRSFSPKADLFAFTTRDTVFVANDVSAQVAFSMPLTPLAARDQPGELAFAPDESILLWQSGDQLGAMALEKNGYRTWAGDLLPPSQCSEEFVPSPKSWCGRSNSGGALAWSPNSRFAAAMSMTHGVRVFDFSDFSAGSELRSSDACSADCNPDFVFQP